MSEYEEIISADADESLAGVSTGLPQLDREIGPTGGFPYGRVVLLTGKYSTGKSSLALFALSQAQKEGMNCLWIDTEMTFDKDHSRMCGVDNSKLKLMRQTTFAEKVFDTVENYLSHTKNAFVVLDSYSGLSTRDETEKDAGAADFGAKSKMVARFFRKIKIPLALNKSILVVMAHEYPRMSGPGMTLAGGDSMAKTPSLWIDLYKKHGVSLKSGEDVVGEVIVAKIKKNKIGGKKYAEADLQFVFGVGWNPVSDLLQDALDREIIKKVGNSFYLGERKLGVGMAKLREAFKDEALQQEIKTLLS